MTDVWEAGISPLTVKAEDGGGVKGAAGMAGRGGSRTDAQTDNNEAEDYLGSS